MDGNAVLGCVVCAVVGGLVLVLAVWQMRTGSMRFLHSYHYVNVPAADRPALALESGRWLAATGAWCFWGSRSCYPVPWRTLLRLPW